MRGGARSNGYSVMVSAEGHRSVNERVAHHRVVLGVLRDAQTPEHRPHTNVQTIGSVLLGSGTRRREEELAE